jgi:peptide deformylase
MDILQARLKILQYPHPSLRHRAAPLKEIDRKVLYVADAMLDLMYEHHGLGLAAPQVGMPFRMFVANYAADREQRELEGVYLNPVIVEKRGTMEGEEGCLSFPQLYQNVRRAKTVRVQAYNRTGELIEHEFSDLQARIWQHEIDHLDGVLFIDKLGPIGKLSARKALREFEYLHKKAQERGELPSDEEAERQLNELESQA